MFCVPGARRAAVRDLNTFLEGWQVRAGSHLPPVPRGLGGKQPTVNPIRCGITLALQVYRVHVVFVIAHSRKRQPDAVLVLFFRCDDHRWHQLRLVSGHVQLFVLRFSQFRWNVL